MIGTEPAASGADTRGLPFWAMCNGLCQFQVTRTGLCLQNRKAACGFFFLPFGPDGWHVTRRTHLWIWTLGYFCYFWLILTQVRKTACMKPSFSWQWTYFNAPPPTQRKKHLQLIDIVDRWSGKACGWLKQQLVVIECDTVARKQWWLWHLIRRVEWKNPYCFDKSSDHKEQPFSFTHSWRRGREYVCVSGETLGNVSFDFPEVAIWRSSSFFSCSAAARWKSECFHSELAFCAELTSIKIRIVQDVFLGTVWFWIIVPLSKWKACPIES